jgi:hypothetical protein
VTLDEKIDTANFNTDNSYNKVGGAWANGDVYEFNELENGRMAVTVFSYVNSENYQSARFPNPNDNDINGLYDEFASYYSVSPIAI